MVRRTVLGLLAECNVALVNRSMPVSTPPEEGLFVGVCVGSTPGIHADCQSSVGAECNVAVVPMVKDLYAVWYVALGCCDGGML